MKSLYQKLIAYEKEGYYPMHMPGHKRNTKLLDLDNIYGIDITEIEGFDNLYHADNILKESMNCAARLYRSDHTYFLVNGSTAGILAGIAACTQKGDKIIVARNCHKSVYNAIFLNELVPIYVYPQFIEKHGLYGGVLPQSINNLLKKHTDIKMVVITSPTYEGIVSDIEEIVKISHQYGIPCMVDEAHGAHFSLSTFAPMNSIDKGADVVIHSLHKTLPSLTQTALIHINHNLVDEKKVRDYLSIYQSSSPSYILMASIDRCVDIIGQYGDKLFHEYYENLTNFYQRMRRLEHIQIIHAHHEIDKKTFNTVNGVFDFDQSKILMFVNNSNISGKTLYEQLLTKYKIQTEMFSNDYVLGMTSIGDTKDGFFKLGDALIDIDKELCVREGKEIPLRRIPHIVSLNSYEAYALDNEIVTLVKSEGRISKDYVYLYPPGVPLLVPGEVITIEFLTCIKEYRELGLVIKGLYDKELKYINVVR